MYFAGEIVSDEFNFKNCLGKLFLDNGQSLDPEPPHKIIGIIELQAFLNI